MNPEEILAISKKAAKIEESEENVDDSSSSEIEQSSPLLFKKTFKKKRFVISASMLVSCTLLLLLCLHFMHYRKKIGDVQILQQHSVTAQPQDLKTSALEEKPEKAKLLPTLEEADKSRAYLAVNAKAHLSTLVKHVWVHAPSPPGEEEENVVIKTVAKCLSGSKTERIVGLKFCVVNVQSLNEIFSGDDSEKKSMDLQAVGVMGLGYDHVLIEVFDVETCKHYALKLHYKLSYDQDPLEAVEYAGKLKKEMEMMHVACCGVRTPEKTSAGAREGVAMGIYIADIKDSFPLSRVSFYSVFGKVIMMEKRGCSFRDILNATDALPLSVKRYIAGRLLLSVLHLQKAQISHNALKWGNFLIDEEGNSSVTGFAQSTKFGNALKTISLEAKDLYKDPQLVLDVNSYLNGGGTSPLPHAKSDLFSLGCMLYELFSNGKLPYLENASGDKFPSSVARAEYLLNEQISLETLSENMQEMEFPKDWRMLIGKLLEPQREKRIGAGELARKYRYLFMK